MWSVCNESECEWWGNVMFFFFFVCVYTHYTHIEYNTHTHTHTHTYNKYQYTWNKVRVCNGHTINNNVTHKCLTHMCVMCVQYNVKNNSPTPNTPVWIQRPTTVKGQWPVTGTRLMLQCMGGTMAGAPVTEGAIQYRHPHPDGYIHVTCAGNIHVRLSPATHHVAEGIIEYKWNNGMFWKEW